MNRVRLLWGAFQTTLMYISARSEPAGRPALTERSQFSFGQARQKVVEEATCRPYQVGATKYRTLCNSPYDHFFAHYQLGLKADREDWPGSPTQCIAVSESAVVRVFYNGELLACSC